MMLVEQYTITQKLSLL